MVSHHFRLLTMCRHCLARQPMTEVKQNAELKPQSKRLNICKMNLLSHDFNCDQYPKNGALHTQARCVGNQFLIYSPDHTLWSAGNGELLFFI